VAELASAAREVADLRVREKDARDDAHEAKEMLMALIERVRTDAVEAERLRKERDDLLRAVEKLRTGIDLARQERADAQQRIDHLKDELEWERDLKVAAEGVSIGLAVEVDQHQEEVSAWRPRLPGSAMRCASFVKTWTVSLWFPLSFSLEFMVSLLTWSVHDLGRSR